MPAEIKPCPFCGKEAHVFRYAFAVSHYDGCYMLRKCTPVASTYLNGPIDYEQWNQRADTMESANLHPPTPQGQNAQSSTSPVA